MARKATNGRSFEELEKELREYLAEVAGDADVDRALKQLHAAHSRLQGHVRHGGGSRRAGSAGEADEPIIAPAKDDLERARALLNWLLPSKAPTLPGLDVAIYTRPCHTIGGDYFDFIELREGRVALAVADASGKGVSAALLMVMLREILHIVVPHTHTAAGAVIETNARLVNDMPRGMFVTCLYAVIDPAAREITLVNAGHCPPLICRPRLTGARLMNVRGPALGVLDTKRFAESIRGKTLAIEQGDCLCFYSDGILEAKDLLGEEFGQAQLGRVFRDNASKPAKKIAEAIVAAVDIHCEVAPQHDDITLIIVRAL